MISSDLWANKMTVFWTSMYRLYVLDKGYTDNSAARCADRDLELFKERIENGDFLLDNNDNK